MKQTVLFTVAGHRVSVESGNRAERQRGVESFFVRLSEDIAHLLHTVFPVPRPSDLDWNLHHWFSSSQIFTLTAPLSFLSIPFANGRLQNS